MPTKKKNESMVITPPPNSHTSRNHKIQHLDTLIFDNQLPQLGAFPAHATTCSLSRK
jgi:hypothetical protein